MAEVSGLRPFVFLALVALVAAAPLGIRHRWRLYRALAAVSAVVLTSIVVLGGFSIGPFFVPAAGCALLAAGTAYLAPAD